MNSEHLLQEGQHLFTKDGRIVGNAIITGFSPLGRGLAVVETDFGNGGSLFNHEEILAWWHPTDAAGNTQVTPVSQWREERMSAQNKSKP